MQRTKNPIQNIYIKPSINAPIQIPMKYMVITNKIADITIKNIDKKSISSILANESTKVAISFYLKTMPK
jgi:hypothetical protein